MSLIFYKDIARLKLTFNADELIAANFNNGVNFKNFCKRSI